MFCMKCAPRVLRQNEVRSSASELFHISDGLYEAFEFLEALLAGNSRYDS